MKNILPRLCADAATMVRTYTSEVIVGHIETKVWPAIVIASTGLGTGQRYLSTVARTGERPRLGYVPNATYP